MNDPYQVLGITRSASQDEIKKAYRTLSRKYHPDANINNPNKAQAEEKFKEIQQAYDQIMDEKENGYQSSYDSGFDGFGTYNSSYSGRSESGFSEEYMMHLRAAANYINNRYYNEALNVLAQMKDRSGQWYYLSALANIGIGNNILATEHAKQALAMEPSNAQFAQLVHQLESGSGWYQDVQRTYGRPDATASGTCTRLCFSYMFCNICINGTMCCNSGYYPYM